MLIEGTGMSTPASKREQRKNPRRKPFHAQDAVSIQVQGAPDGPVKALIMDLSSVGMSIRSGHPLRTGVHVKVSGQILEIKGRTPFSRSCRVCWTATVGPEEYAAGMAFEEPV